MELGENDLVLLGAGASAEAGVPMTFELTERLAERIRAEHGWRQPDVASALNFICGALIAYDAAEGSSAFEGLDVERVFAAVELLAQRRTLEVTPFVAAWHPAVDAWDQQTRTVPAFFDDNFRQGILSKSSTHAPGRMINQLVDARAQASVHGGSYERLAKLMLSELRDLVATTPKAVSYLGPLALKASSLPSGLTIATLNYDLGIEGAAELHGVPVDTGLAEWLEAGRWAWSSSGVRLLKLHGSIDWSWSRTLQEHGEFQRGIVSITDHSAGFGDSPALIFGQREKLTAEGPFLGLLAEFERFLAKANRLLVIGYSFRDDHVNELIRRWLADDSARDIVVVDPGWPTGDGPPLTGFRRELQRQLIEWREPREFEDRLTLIREPCSEAVAALV